MSFLSYNLPKLFYSSNLWWIPWDTVCTRLCHLQIEILFCYFLSPQYALYVIFWLTVLDRTSSIRLNRSSENREPCLLPGLRGKVFRVSLLSVMPYLNFQRRPSSGWESATQVLAFRVFLPWDVVEILPMIFLHLWRWLQYKLISCVKASSFSRLNSTDRVYNLFSILLGLVCQCFVEEFCISIHKR